MTERQATGNPAMMDRPTTQEGHRGRRKEEWKSMKRLKLGRGLVAVAAMAIIAGACSATPGGSGGAAT